MDEDDDGVDLGVFQDSSDVAAHENDGSKSNGRYVSLGRQDSEDLVEQSNRILSLRAASLVEEFQKSNKYDCSVQFFSY